MSINEFFDQHFKRSEPHYIFIFPRVLCNDGFHMSVQGHKGAYCYPRTEYDTAKNICGGFDQVEVGFPSEREELLMPYVEDENRPTETVYGYVPVSVVNNVIAKHGGLKGTMEMPQ